MPNPADDFDPIAEALALNAKRPRPLTQDDIKREMERCRVDPVYFITKYCFIYDNATLAWIHFDLWPSQVELLRSILKGKYHLVPKARQLGITWLVGVALVLWFMIFHPIAEILLFSQRDDEAMGLLGRIKGNDEDPNSTFKLLPAWMKPKVITDNNHEFKLGNGSRIQALPATAGGRSNAGTYVVVDEADYIADLRSLITAAKPVIDAGDNRMVVLSTINEKAPNSYFQRLCAANAESEAGWALHFLGWRAHPGRDDAWYEAQKTTSLVDNGSLDPLYKEYPATLQEALAPREQNKRFAPQWIADLSVVRKPVPMLPDMPPIPGLKVYKVPLPGHSYGIGVDPGGGKVDPSVAQVVDKDTREQVAVLAGLVEPTQFANHVHDLSVYYFNAPVLFELNNHGHAFLAQSKEAGTTLKPGIGRRGQKDREPGWLTTERSKNMLFDVGAKVMQEAVVLAMQLGAMPAPILCDTATIAELQSIEISTLEAPEGMHDDHAMAWVLAQMCVYQGVSSMQQVPYSGLWHKREEVDVPYRGPGSRRVGTVADITPEEKRQSEFTSKVVDKIVPRPQYDEDTPIPPHILERFGRFTRR